VYLAVAGHDTLRDDGLLFKMKLDDNEYGPWIAEMDRALLTKAGCAISSISTKGTLTTFGCGRRRSWKYRGSRSMQISRKGCNS
jgi:hypothetical protein